MSNTVKTDVQKSVHCWGMEEGVLCSRYLHFEKTKREKCWTKIIIQIVRSL